MRVIFECEFLGCYKPTPLKRNLSWFLNRWGNSFLRASSLSHVSSVLVCLPHWTWQIQMLIVLVCLVTVSRIYIGTSWYLRSSCKSTISGDICSSGTLAISSIGRHGIHHVYLTSFQVAEYGRLRLQSFATLGIVWNTEVLVYLWLGNFESLELEKLWDTQNLQLQNLTTVFFYQNSSSTMIVLPSIFPWSLPHDLLLALWRRVQVRSVLQLLTTSMVS